MMIKKMFADAKKGPSQGLAFESENTGVTFNHLFLKTNFVKEIFSQTIGNFPN